MLIYQKQKLAWFITSLLLLVNSLSYAQIAADHTMGTVVTPKITGTGTNFLISQGRQEGNNLFHSFGDFNLHQSETATFVDPKSPMAITNILARVTGDKASFIDGQIQSDIPGANLYFLNPNGIRFGEHARLNLSGSFHASTAKGIKLGNDGEFLADSSHQSILSIAPPSAFGFFDGSTSAPIKIEGNSLLLKNRPAKENDTFYAPNGKIDVTSNGDLRIEDKTLYAPNGQITLSTTGKLQLSQSSWGKVEQVKINVPNTDGKDELTPVLVGNINVSGDNGGQIFIRAGQFILDKSIILADTYKDNKGLGGINIAVDREMHLTNGAQITADNVGNSQGSRITIKTERLQLDGQNSEVPGEQNLSRIATNNFNSGKGGEIEINASTLEIMPGLIQAETIGSGDAGNIIIKSQQAWLTNNGLIRTRTSGTGQAGNISIAATEKITISNTSLVSASTRSSGKKGGNINLETPLLTLANKGQINVSSTGSGNAGSITLDTDALSLTDESSIVAIANQAGGGDINIQARHHIYLFDKSIIASTARGNSEKHKGGNLTISKPEFFVLCKSLLLANAFAGNGGDITITADSFIDSSDSVISASSRKGLSGKVQINARDWDFRENHFSLPKFQQTELFPNRCAFSKDNLSRFLITSRDILPPTPEDLRTHSIRL